MANSVSRIALLACVVASGLLLANPAIAADWADAAVKVTGFAKAGKVALIALCALGGAGAIAYAGKLLLKKSGDRGDDVEWSKIGIAVVAGAFLLSITWIASTTVETFGGAEAVKTMEK